MAKPLPSALTLLLTLLTLTALAACTAKQQPQAKSAISASRLHIPKVNTPIQVDGLLNDKAWRRSAAFSGFVITNGMLATPQTSGRIAYDSKNLYISFSCDITTGTSLKAKATGIDDKKTFNDDSVEIFIHGNTLLNTYYHLAINSVGACYSAKCQITPTKKIDSSWHPKGIKIGTSQSADTWTAELSLPLKSLGIKRARPGRHLAFNFGRNNRASKWRRATSSWTGVSDFHEPALFGKALLAPAKPNAILQNVTINNLGFRGNVHCLNPSDEPVYFSVKTSLKHNAAHRKILVPAASTGIVPFALAVEDQGELYKQNLPTVIEVQANNQLAFKRSRIVALEENSGRLSGPTSFYYTAGDRKVDFFCGKLEREIIQVKATLFDPQNQECGSTATIVTEHKATGTVKPTSPLKTGRYRLKIVGTDLNQQLHTLSDKMLYVKHENKRQGLPSIKTIDIKNDIFYINDKPFFSYGGTLRQKYLPKWLPICFNTNNALGAVRENAPKILTGGLPWVTRDKEVYFLFEENNLLFQQIKEHIEKQSNESGHSLFRRIRYESQMSFYQKTPTGKTRRDYTKFHTKLADFYKKTDPTTFHSIHAEYSSGLVPVIANMNVDVIETSFLSSGFNETLIPNLVRDIKRTKKDCKGKPLVIRLGASVRSSAHRTAEEMRCGLYLTMLNNVAGTVIHMEHHGIPEFRTRFWSLFSGVADEIDILFPIIHSPDIAPPKLLLDTSTIPKDISCHIKRVGNKIYLIAVNTSPARNVATFSINSRLLKKNHATVIFENRSKRINAGKWTDIFEGYEPHVYELTLLP